MYDIPASLYFGKSILIILAMAFRNNWTIVMTPKEQINLR